MSGYARHMDVTDCKILLGESAIFEHHPCHGNQVCPAHQASALAAGADQSAFVD